MFAEILSLKSNFKFDIHVLFKNENKIITTIPSIKKHNIFFEPNHRFQISFLNYHFVYTFDVQLNSFKKINDNYFVVFTIESEKHHKNVRKEPRKNVNLSAVFFTPQSNTLEFAQVLDKSNNGLRIQTAKPIQGKFLDITFTEGDEIEKRRTRITWQNKQGEHYYYGLESCM